jgi:hypothetical protein
MATTTPPPEFNVNLGDLPTWLGVVAASVAAIFVYLQLRSQQREIARQVAVLERQQANDIDVRRETIPVTGTTDKKGAANAIFHWGVAVENTSRRPIRNVVAKIQASPDVGLADAVKAGFANRHSGMIDFRERSEIHLMRADNKCGFFFDFPVGKFHEARMVVRFDDDAGLSWQIDQDLHLQKIKQRDW